MQKIERLGRADSDFSAFLHIAGVPSIDMFYGDGMPLFSIIMLNNCVKVMFQFLVSLPCYVSTFTVSGKKLYEIRKKNLAQD